MTRLYLATGDALAVVGRRNGRWAAELRLQGQPTQCVAADPLRPEVLYCGTFGRGLLRSDDGGERWQPVGEGIAHAEVMAVAASRTAPGVVWAGTEPSALFRSEDGGASWQERPALRQIPSHPTWSFPPRPGTHHVRWIEPDPLVDGRLFVAIELGGVMKSEDGGLTWQDRKPGAKLDAHTLRAHPLAPGRLYEAAGDGYAETGDGGATWRPGDGGLAWRYLWGMAVDAADPETVIVSASPGPRHAHDADWGDRSWEEEHRRAPAGVHDGPPPWSGHGWRGPEAWLYRRAGDGPWQVVREGLPDPRGTLAYVLAADEAEPHVFYASPRSDAIYRSQDAGRSWQRLDVAWPDGYRPRRVQAMAVTAA
jgi:photosystem II stability/assembly factor-like uncharacterized protein